MARESLKMIANVLTLGILLFLLFVYYEVTGELFVFFIVMNALIIAAAIGFTRSLEVMRLMDASGSLYYALWSEFAGLFCGSAVIFFCVLVSFFVILDFERYDY